MHEVREAHPRQHRGRRVLGQEGRVRTVFLRSLAIKNFRGLEDAELDKLDRFNVLIGRNNSGKSSVFGALQLVNGVVNDTPFDTRRVLTDLDMSRSLEVHLTFETEGADREEILSLLYATPQLQVRREQVRSSPFGRRIEYLLKAPAGRPEYLHPHEIRVLTEDGQWAVIQRIVSLDAVANPGSRMIDLSIVRERYSGYVLNSDLLSLDRSARSDASLAR